MADVTEAETVLECGVGLRQSVGRNGADAVGAALGDRDWPTLTAEPDRVLLQYTLVGRDQHLERIAFTTERRRERDDDRGWSVLVADVVLNDETETWTTLIGASRWGYLDDHTTATANVHRGHRPLRHVAEGVVGVPRDASQLVGQFPVLVGATTIPLREVRASGSR